MTPVQHRFTTRLQDLAQNLPSRFTHVIRDLEKDISLLFSPKYPSVLTHGDLSEMNILVDKDNGHLTGVIDWAEAEILPFGCALWSLENLLGFMDHEGWHYFPVHQELRDLFWKTFKECIPQDLKELWLAICTARRIGVLFRYGFCWVDGGSRQRVICGEDSDMKYLDAFLVDT